MSIMSMKFKLTADDREVCSKMMNNPCKRAEAILKYLERLGVKPTARHYMFACRINGVRLNPEQEEIIMDTLR